MLKLIRKAILCKLALLIAVGLTAAGAAFAQTVVYDWSSDSKVPESYPKITKRQTVTFRITNVNDILFSYKLRVTQTPLETDDFKHISGLFKVFNVSPALTQVTETCPSLEGNVKRLIQTAIQEISTDPKLPVGYAASPTHNSIALQESINAWRSHAAAIKEAMDEMAEFRRQQCRNETLENAFQDFLNSAQKIENKVNSSHVFVDVHEIAPGNDVSVDVIEMFNSETIQTKTFTFPGTDILTLSAGTVFSAIPDRAYESRKSPTSTLNVLTVEGNSRATPSLVGLLNYSLGAIGLDGETAGLALSAGPVLKLGAKSNASSFGFFTGLSAHLYHRFYVTPGFHFGQFADFPVGFGNESTVPANFGELTPVKRWTARFGLAITFKAKDFSGLTSSDSPSVKTEGGGGSKPASPPNGDSSAANSTSVLRNSVARTFLRPVSEGRSPTAGRESEDLASGDQALATGKSNRWQTPRSVAAPGASPGDSFVSSAANRSVVNHVTSLSVESSSTDERLILNAENPIRYYAAYFKSGRFYIVISKAKLDVIQDELRGRVFSEPVLEKRGDDLVLSFALLPGTKVKLQEHSAGLGILLVTSSAN